MKLSPWGPRHGAISAIGLEGLLCVDILGEGLTVNAERFLEFLNNHLVPTLNPFNGVNSWSVVVLGKSYRTIALRSFNTAISTWRHFVANY